MTLSKTKRAVTINGSDSRHILIKQHKHGFNFSNTSNIRGVSTVGLMFGDGIVNKVVTLPKMPDSEIEPTILLNEESAYFYSTDKPRISFLKLGENNGQITLLLSVVNTRKADLKSSMIDFDCDVVTSVPAAILALVSHDDTLRNGSHIFIHTETTTAGFHIFKNGLLNFTREISLDFDSYHNEISAETARSVAYWLQENDVDIDYAWIVGERYRETTLIDNITASINLMVAPYDPTDRIVDRSTSTVDGPLYAPLIGATLPGGDAIDLAQSKADRVKKTYLRYKKVGIAGAVAMVIVAFLAFEFHQINSIDRKIADLSVKINRMEKERNRYDDSMSKLASIKKENQLLSEKIRKFPFQKRIKIDLATLFFDISNRLPENSALIEWSVDAQNKNSENGSPVMILIGLVRGDENQKLSTVWNLVSDLKERFADGNVNLTLGAEESDGEELRFTIVTPLSEAKLLKAYALSSHGNKKSA